MRPISFPWQQGGGLALPVDEDMTGTLTKNQTLAVAQPVATDLYNLAITGDVAATLATHGSTAGASGPTVMQPVAMTPAMQVRRLTCVECERLQGFQDGYTAIPWRNKPADQCPDGPRYKALGNSMAVPVIFWIGQQINKAK